MFPELSPKSLSLIKIVGQQLIKRPYRIDKRAEVNLINRPNDIDHSHNTQGVSMYYNKGRKSTVRVAFKSVIRN